MGQSDIRTPAEASHDKKTLRVLMSRYAKARATRTGLHRSIACDAGICAETRQ